MENIKLIHHFGKIVKCRSYFFIAFAKSKILCFVRQELFRKLLSDQTHFILGSVDALHRLEQLVGIVLEGASTFFKYTQ